MTRNEPSNWIKRYVRATVAAGPYSFIAQGPEVLALGVERETKDEADADADIMQDIWDKCPPEQKQCASIAMQSLSRNGWAQ
jgi:hypothetical protein